MSLSEQKLIYIAVCVLVFAALGWYAYYTGSVLPRRRNQEEKCTATEKAAAEAARIAALPKLNTQWLLKAPPKMVAKQPLLRHYGSRYNKIFIVDDQGCAWMGLAVPEVLDSLVAAEYTLHDFWIPCCGPGEAQHGEPVMIDGIKIEIYPSWLRPGTNMSDWQLWADIERHFDHIRSTGWNYQNGLMQVIEAARARQATT